MPIKKALSLLTALSLLSCTSQSDKGQKQALNLNIKTNPPTLDPRRTSDSSSLNVIRFCFDGLMRKDEKETTSLGVARAVIISEDKKSYTFFLKKTKWSDGTPLTAHDFVSAWRSILDPQFPSEFAFELFFIKGARLAKENKIPLDDVGIKALADDVIEVHLEHPVPYFLDMLTTSTFYPIPSHVIAKDPTWARNGGPGYVCNGPFEIKEWKHSDKIVLKKNPNYYDSAKVRLDTIQMYMVEDDSAELSMYETGDIDWIGSPFSSIASDAIPTLSELEDFQSYDIAGTYYYIFNTKEFPFNNVHIRRAFCYAIHRKEIINNLLQGKQRPASGLIPPTMWQSSEYFEDGDIALAQEELELGLKELNIKKEDLPVIKLSYNTNNGHHKIAQAIQSQWRKVLDIEVSLESMEWKVFLDSVRTHTFQVARMGGIASFRDPITFLSVYQHETSPMNQCQWSDPEFSRLIDLAEQEKDQVRRMEHLIAAEKIFIDQMPIAPIYFYSGSYLKKPYLKKVHISDLSDIDFKYSYLESK